MNEDQLYLTHISECLEWIEEYTRSGREGFMTSRMVRDAVLRNFEVMGEAVKRLSLPLRQQYPAVPWQRIAGLRDILIHNYVGVDIEMVWTIVEEDLPGLKQHIMTILQELPDTATS